MTLRKVVLAVPLVALVLVLSSLTAVGQSAGLELNVVTVVIPGEIQGSFQTLVVPLNVSDLSMLSESNTYVVVSGVPRISYLFSRNPPLVLFVEPSAYSGTYEVWYGGGNPYTQYIGTPGSSMSFWLAYDDFDYATGFWLNSSISIVGSRVYVSPGGYLALSRAYSPKTVHLWLVHGRKGLVITFSQPYSGFVSFTLTQNNFTDITQVVDGSDVYFIDPLGSCLPYAVILYDQLSVSLQVAVNPGNNTVVYMLYGGVNPCTTSRVGSIHALLLGSAG